MRDMSSKPRLQEIYESKVVPLLRDEFKYANTMQIPRLVKVVLNMGLGEAIQNPKMIESAQRELASITGQKPVVTRSRKSIAAFKLREGMPIGCTVTLRRQNMWEFMDRLINMALPRVRDFQGVSPRGFDRRGNYTLGVKEQIIFHEIDYDKIDKVKGLNITVVTTAPTDEEARSLLKGLGMPFRR